MYLFGFSNEKLSLLYIEHKQTVQHNAYDQDPYAKEFGIKISEKLTPVEARILPAPWVIYPKSIIKEKKFISFIIDHFIGSLQLKYHETGKEKDCLPQVGQWNMMNKVIFLCLFSILFMLFSMLWRVLPFLPFSPSLLSREKRKIAKVMGS